MIVADTGGVIALLDHSDKHHAAVRRLFEARRDAWVLPWAILPEVDYLASSRLGEAVALAFAEDVAEGLFVVDGTVGPDIARALDLLRRYSDLKLGLVDAVVMAQAERHQASIIVTTDSRHFRAVDLEIRPRPRLVPLDAARAR